MTAFTHTMVSGKAIAAYGNQRKCGRLRRTVRMGDLMGKNGKRILLLAGFAGLLFLAFKYLFPLAAPFLLAFLIVHFCSPWLDRVQKRTHIRKEILLGGMLLLAAALLLCAVWGVFSWGSVHASGLGEGMAAMQHRMDGALRDCCTFLERNFGMDAAGTYGAIRAKINELLEGLRADALPEAAKRSWEYIRGMIGGIAFLGVSFISTMLLCRDYEVIAGKIGENPMVDAAWQFLDRTASLIGGYLRAQAVILLVISVVATLGLFIGRVRGAAALGLLAGLLDALPFIGTGIVLVPTALWQLLEGNIPGAVCGVVVYVLCVMVRELLEPRLLGKQVGMRPVVMLFGVYAGVRLFGLAGIFLGPLYLVLFREAVMTVQTDLWVYRTDRERT